MNELTCSTDLLFNYSNKFFISFSHLFYQDQPVLAF